MKPTDKKAIITKVAQNIFSRYGLFKTTMDEIAKAARMGKASLYHYFTGKEEIFKEVVKKENRFLIEKIQEAVSKEDAPQKKMRAYILTRMKYLNELTNIHSALNDEYLDHYSFIEKIREINFKKETEIIQAILKEGLEKGICEIRDIELTSFVIILTLKGLEYPWSAKILLPEDAEQNTDKLLEILFYGIVKK